MLSQQTPNLDYRRLVRQSSKLDTSRELPRLRLALLSDAASQQFVPLLMTLFHENGVTVEIYEGAFDAIEIECHNAGSALYAFNPEVIVLATSSQSLRSRYYHSTQSGFAEETIARLSQVWDSVQSNSTARVIQFNFPLPYERPFGNFDLKVAGSLRSTVAEINRLLAESVRSSRGNILLCDIESMASLVGRRQWFDERLWHMSKTFCNLELLPLVSQALVEMVMATRGRIVKCVILDLDNTCWGGVVGDDGPHGISISSHGDGEAYYYFQHFLLSLKRRGILLAVCSKNDYDIAIQPFVVNPEMVLKLTDITVFIANWEDKAANIRRIRDTLELGFDSMVFLDDNPFERNLVRQYLPEVIVPELPEDPSDYVSAISDLNLFETASFSDEDVSRSQLYKQEADRRQLQSNFSNIQDYLVSLDMRIEVARFEESKIARIAQLIQRSNQFNLTTRRHSEAECRRMMLDAQTFIPLYVSLADRFGDHGLISVVILLHKPNEPFWEITDWLMSCRVLSRGVEQYVMNHIVDVARGKGLKSIRGRYLPTAKNGMVCHHFRQFGFRLVAENAGQTTWDLDVASYEIRQTCIQQLVEA